MSNNSENCAQLKNSKTDWVPIKPNENVLLQKMSVIVKIDNNEIKVDDAELWLCFFPRPRVEIKGMFIATKAVFNALGSQKIINLYHSDGSVEIPGICTKYEIKIGKNEIFMTWFITPVPFNLKEKNAKSIKYFVFHLFNFVDLIGARRNFEYFEDKGHLIHYLDFIWKDWKVEIRSLYGKKETYNTLEEDGGFALTHVGYVRESNGKSFSINKAEYFLNALRYFLSFARGFWCYPILCAGFDKHGDKKWRAWDSPREPWQNPLSWFDPQHPDQLINLFPGFMDKCQVESWRDTFREVIYWYLNSNNSYRGIDAGIILTQAAIERLSFEYAVQSKKLITVDGFNKIWASDKFRILFSSLDIPIEIPSCLTNLIKLSKDSQIKWIDAPHALTEVRNSLVHPQKKPRNKFKSIYFETWKLGLWYLELSILRLCGYEGTYSNRLTAQMAGQVEKVPWENK